MSGNNKTSAAIESGVREAVANFFRAGDEQNSALFQEWTHGNFRVIAPDYPAAGTVSVIDRTSFSDLIEKKKLGGTPRKISFESIAEQGERAATAEVFLEGKELDFRNQITLVRESDGWRVIQDLARVFPKKSGQ